MRDKKRRVQGFKDSRVQGFKWDKKKGSRVQVGQKEGAKGSRGRVSMLKNYQELKVWQKSYSLCLKVYRATRAFPQDEKYGLTSQMRRSAVSVPSNIAEGYGRKTTLDYLHSLYIAYGSLCELQTQLLLALDLGYYHRNESDDLIRDVEEVERMLRALMNSLKRKT